MARKKTSSTINPMENKKRATEPPPPFAPPGDYERAISSGAITKDERPPALPRGGGKLSPQDQHFKDRSERHKTDRVKKLFANATAPRAQTTGALKPTASESDINAAFDDEDTDRDSDPMTMTASSDELGIDVETSITRKHDDDR